MSSASETGSSSVSNQLSSLVPTFDPSTDDLLIYQQKVELVLAPWPKGKLQELITRLILGCKGTAFQKLQIHQTELIKGDEECVRKLIEHLGGQWGKIPLERQYEDAEQALYHTIQKSDEGVESIASKKNEDRGDSSPCGAEGILTDRRWEETCHHGQWGFWPTDNEKCAWGNQGPRCKLLSWDDWPQSRQNQDLRWNNSPDWPQSQIMQP